MDPEPTDPGPFEMHPIGIIHSCFPEKFGIPRQPGLVPEAEARLELLPPYNRPEAVRELEGFSHVWVLFLFHHCLREAWKPMVRPPRLGGKRRVGVFATRAPYRPNPIGLSAVELRGIDTAVGRVQLHLGGIDLVDGTPVLDIKPYLPFADSLPAARAGFSEATTATADLPLVFAAQPEAFLSQLPVAEGQRLRRLIDGLLRQDPRPAYQPEPQRSFGMRLEGLNIRWDCDDKQVCVTHIGPWNDSHQNRQDPAIL